MRTVEVRRPQPQVHRLVNSNNKKVGLLRFFAFYRKLSIRIFKTFTLKKLIQKLSLKLRKTIQRMACCVLNQSPFGWRKVHGGRVNLLSDVAKHSEKVHSFIVM